METAFAERPILKIRNIAEFQEGISYSWPAALGSGVNREQTAVILEKPPGTILLIRNETQSSEGWEAIDITAWYQDSSEEVRKWLKKYYASLVRREACRNIAEALLIHKNYKQEEVPLLLKEMVLIEDRKKEEG